MRIYSWLVARTYRSTPTATAALVVRLAIILVALSVFSVLLAQAVLFGFYHKTPKHLQDFGGQLAVLPYDSGLVFDSVQAQLSADPKTVAAVAALRPYAVRPVLLKTATRVKGLQFKGMTVHAVAPATPVAPQAWLAPHLIAPHLIIQGRTIRQVTKTEKYVPECVLGIGVARSLGLKLGDAIVLHFIGQHIQYRKLNLVGLFQTGMEEVDQQVVLGDLALLQDLGGRDSSLVAGIEVLLLPGASVQVVQQQFNKVLGYAWHVVTIEGLYPQIMEWLDMLRRNVYIFLGLIILVAGFNMIAIAMIFIMERAYMVGVLRALGISAGGLRAIFLSYGLIWILQGLFWGNVIALVVAGLQQHFRIITLDATNYLLSYMPIHLFWGDWLWYNGVFIAVLVFALWLPMRLLVRVAPLSALRW